MILRSLPKHRRIYLLEALGMMNNSGYYEIVTHSEERTGLRMNVIAGNVLFNRLHWHESLEIFCCIYGSVHVNIQGNAYALEAGDLVTVASGLSHEITEGSPDGLQLIFSVDPSLQRVPGDEQYAFSTVGEGALAKSHKDICAVRGAIARLAADLIPDAQAMSKLADMASSGNHKVPGSQNSEAWTVDALKTGHLYGVLTAAGGEHSIEEMYTDEQWYQFHMELYGILRCLSRHKVPAVAQKEVSRPYGRFIQCVEMIHKDYDKPINAGLLAREIGFSEPTIYRLFHENMGISFNHYLNSVRVSAACGLMENSDLSMTEIAARCGFASLSNFYRAFHQFVGMPPREYRKYRGDGGLGSHGVQKDLMMQNRFLPLWELPYGREDLLRIGAEA